MRASGKFADELVVETTDDSAKIIGEKYAEQLEYGRKRGKRPPVEALKQWVIDKGIASQAKKVSSIAWAIAYKISQKGWKRQKHGGVELVSKVVTDKRIQEIIDKVGNELTITLVSRLEKEFLKIKV